MKSWEITRDLSLIAYTIKDRRYLLPCSSSSFHFRHKYKKGKFRNIRNLKHFCFDKLLFNTRIMIENIYVNLTRSLLQFDVSSVFSSLLQFDVSSVFSSLLQFNVRSVFSSLLQFDVSSVFSSLLQFDVSLVISSLLQFGVSSVFSSLQCATFYNSVIPFRLFLLLQSFQVSHARSSLIHQVLVS